MIHWNDFAKIDMRLGIIVKAEEFPEAIKPAYILTLDFGSETGIKKSSAQITRLYNKKQLKGESGHCSSQLPPQANRLFHERMSGDGCVQRK